MAQKLEIYTFGNAYISNTQIIGVSATSDSAILVVGDLVQFETVCNLLINIPYRTCTTAPSLAAVELILMVHYHMSEMV